MAWRGGVERWREVGRDRAGEVVGRFGADLVLAGHAAVAPPARRHREAAHEAAEREGGEHDDHHRRAPLVAEEPADAGFVLVVQREREQREEEGGSNEPDKNSHRDSQPDSRCNAAEHGPAAYTAPTTER